MSPAPVQPVFLGMPRPEHVADGRLRIGNASRGGLVARDVLWLRTRWQRFALAWARRPDRHGGLFLAPAPAVHSFGAGGGLRVLVLESSLHVLEVRLLPPWRAAPLPPPAQAALLLAEDNPAAVQAGDRLEWLAPQPRLPGRADWLDPNGYPPVE